MKGGIVSPYLVNGARSATDSARRVHGASCVGGRQGDPNIAAKPSCVECLLILPLLPPWLLLNDDALLAQPN